MAVKTVTPEQMAEALEVQANGILSLLGIDLTAEMGQTHWLRGSEDGEGRKPLLDLGKLSAAVHDLAHNVEGFNVQLTQAQHPFGLCDSETCPTCRDQRTALASQISEGVEEAPLAKAGKEIDLVCEYARAPGLRDTLATALQRYRDAGRPGLDASMEPMYLVAEE